MSTEMLYHIASQFQLPGEIVRIEKFGTGLINTSYRSIITHGDSSSSYIHQKINQHVFPEPAEVIENMVVVTTHIREKLRQDRPIHRRATLELVPTKDGQFSYLDENGDYWRTTYFIPDNIVYDTVQSPHHAREAGRILGEFQRIVSDIPAGRLHDTLPGFHDTPNYYERFLHSLDNPHSDRRIEARKHEADVCELVRQLKQREALAPLLISALKDGTLQERVVHNDPKINNILFDCHTDCGICLIDLDTVKNGLIHFDYGDCLRTVANPPGEETRNIQEVYFDLKSFEALTEGYLKEAQSFLTDADIDYLIDSIKVIVFEQTIRFLHDYLQGDVYYTPAYPTHNLSRALGQCALLRDIEKKEASMRTMVTRYFQQSHG